MNIIYQQKREQATDGSNQKIATPPKSGQQGEWIAPYFIPTHDFISFYNQSGNALGAVYHSSVHAWSVRLANQSLKETLPAANEALACLLRNAPADGLEGTGAADNDRHTIRYAIRISSGIPAKPSLQFIKESRSIASPLAAMTPKTPATPAGPSDDGYVRWFKHNFSLASVSDDAVINVAKIGSRRPVIGGSPANTDESLILRIFTYSPQKPLTVYVPDTAAIPGFKDIKQFNLDKIIVTGINAMEEDLSKDLCDALQIKILSSTSFSFIPQRNLTTLRVDRLWNDVLDFN